MIFVFGSNEAGIHGKGAALIAKLEHGAIYGQGYGLQGESFAIPTKDRKLRPLSLTKIERYVQSFLTFAQSNPELSFIITRIGCGLAGFTDTQIAPLFEGAPINCLFDRAWQPYLGEGVEYWGTYSIPR